MGQITSLSEVAGGTDTVKCRLSIAADHFEQWRQSPFICLIVATRANRMRRELNRELLTAMAAAGLADDNWPESYFQCILSQFDSSDGSMATYDQAVDPGPGRIKGG